MMYSSDSQSVLQLYRWLNISAEAKAYLQSVDAGRQSVSEEHKKFFSSFASESRDAAALFSALRKGQKPSEFFRKHMDWMFGTYILPRHREAFLWAADHCPERPYTQGLLRRPLRSPDYADYMQVIRHGIIRRFADQAVIDADVCDILSGNLPPDALAFARDCHAGCCPEIIAYELNQGNAGLKALLAASLNGDEGAPGTSRTIFLGILLSNDAELQELLCRLLLAARLQEGLRQSICECADEGTLAGFRRILDTIAENDLIRYSSVKRAVGVWTGLLGDEAAGLDRIPGKTLALLLRGLESPQNREAMLRSEDSMEIHMGLWSEAMLDVTSAVRKAQNLIETGSRHQALVCGFFGTALQNAPVHHLLAKTALAKWPDDQEMLALYLPGFLGDAVSPQPLSDAAAKGGKQSLSPYFADAAEARRFYALLKGRYSALAGREKTFAPCVFPWYGVSLRKSDLAWTLCTLAVMLGEDAIADDAADLLPQIETYRRDDMLSALLTPLKRPAQRKALMSALADKSTGTRKKAFEIAEKAAPEDLDFPVIESHLRLKAPDVRVSCTKLLMRQEDTDLLGTIKRLLADPRKQMRTAACDLVMLIAADSRRAHLKSACADLLRSAGPKDVKERILWDSAMQAVREEREHPTDEMFTQEDAFEPDLSFFDTDPGFRDAFFRLFPDSGILRGKTGIGGVLRDLLTGKQDCPSCTLARRDLRALDELIDEHREDPIGEDPFDAGRNQLLGYGRLDPYWCYREFPCAALWEKWYASLGDPGRLVRAILLLHADPSADGDLMERLFGSGFSLPEKLRYCNQAGEVCGYLLRRHRDEGLLFKAAMRAAEWVVREVPEARFAEKTGKDALRCITFSSQLSWILSFLEAAPENAWPQCFAVRTALWRRFEREYISAVRALKQPGFHWYQSPQSRYDMINSAGSHGYREGGRRRIAPEAPDMLRAAFLGIMTERAMLNTLFQPDSLRASVDVLSRISLFVRTRTGEVRGAVGRGWRRRFRGVAEARAAEALTGKKQADFAQADEDLLQYADGIYEKILPLILDSELRRGESEGPYSACVFGIRYVRGAAWLGRLLAALDGDSFSRSATESYYAESPSRKDSLCHLLSVCVPALEDGAEDLGSAVKENGVPDKRLFETAMYNPAWVELIGDYLHIPGFTSAAYYFIAHMNESFDDARMADIARFTPLTGDDLKAGAFDIAWFRSAWETAGEAVFDQLYDAAKYITESTRHTRARKYADAALGRLSVEETEKQIRQKRSKDLLMAYSLIPLSGEEDTLRRYLFIQQFVKESRQFGAQRCASERKAGEMALKNLAANSGDSDMTRLTLRMEGRLAENSLPLFENQAVEDITVRLEMAADGSVTVACEKDGKRLKSIPARLKKNETVLRLEEARKELTGQYRRTRAFLEDAMTEETPLTGRELAELRKNPVARFLTDNLVFMAGDRFGLPCGDGLQDENGRILPWEACGDLYVAHALRLYRASVWHDWQAAMFARQIRQPFKQVFRELYVKTKDELGRTDTLRYAGYQIQPRKAAATLKTRRWIADTEAGLQKVFYRENAVAVLFAQADWFTPADIEAPAIESVGFFRRLTGEPLKIDDVPDILFSEVMRDIDLAVSVAYVGGVDPETSHSTIEMRAALLDFTLPMFGIQNVRVDRNHAVIQGKLSSYTVHLGSGIVHQQGGTMLQIAAVHSQHRGKLFLPFVDDDPQTAEILTKVLFLAEDHRIRDPLILEQIR